MEVPRKEVGFNKSAGDRRGSDRALSNSRFTLAVLEQILTQPFFWVGRQFLGGGESCAFGSLDKQQNQLLK